MNLPIYVENLSKIYKLYDDPSGRLKEALFRGRKILHQKFTALKDISFSVGKGETVGVIGRNGSGKSTLLQIIASIVSPTSGTVEINGRISALLELGSGFDPEFTGRENVYLNGSILGLSRKEIEDRFELIERFAGIGRFIDQPVKKYSSGMYVRLAFATAINVDPDILLVDEALAVGDAIFQHRCMRKIREFQSMGKTIFFVSHDIGAVSKLCTKAILLEKGEMVCMGDVQDVVQEYYKYIWNAEDDIDPLVKESLEAPADISSESEERMDKITHYDHRFGSQKGEIINFLLTDENGNKKDNFKGGEKMVFTVAIKCFNDIDMPMFGFIIKDLLGHEFVRSHTEVEDGNNHTLSPSSRNSIIKLSSSFVLPNLQPGTYTISAGFGNGTTNTPEVYDWIDNVHVFTLECSYKFEGLIRTPVQFTQKVIKGHG